MSDISKLHHLLRDALDDAVEVLWRLDEAVESLESLEEETRGLINRVDEALRLLGEDLEEPRVRVEDPAIRAAAERLDLSVRGTVEERAAEDAALSAAMRPYR